MATTLNAQLPPDPCPQPPSALAALGRTAGRLEGPEGWLEGVCRQVNFHLDREMGGAIDVRLSPSRVVRRDLCHTPPPPALVASR